MNLLRASGSDAFPDPGTDPRLLPDHLRQESNGEILRCCRAAATLGVHTLLPSGQRTLVRMHFYDKLSKAEISRRTGLSPSCVSKRIATALNTLRAFVGFCAEVYGALAREESCGGSCEAQIGN